MPTPAQRRFQIALFAVVCLLLSLLVWHVAAQMPVSLAPPNAATLPVPTSHPAFGTLPAVPVGAPQAYPAAAPVPMGPLAVNAGTPGLVLPTPQARTGVTFAILGDRTSGEEWGLKVLRRSVQELNRLRPDLVLSIGDQVQGYTRSGVEYAREATEYRAIADQLTMPWYPLAGNHDVVAGTRDASDHRFERLYQKYFGPLYYSLDYGDLHFVMLYSDEQLQSQPMISEAQLAWLKNDLNRTFENRRQQGGGGHVFVLIHKPMWRYPKSNWNKVAELLVAFNERPVVSVEGAGTPAAAPPKVDAVFAGHLHAFCDEGVKDAIHYYLMPATGAGTNQDKLTGQIQGYLLVKVDAQGPHIALTEPGSVHADDYVVAADRAVFEKVAALDEKTIGITGMLDQPVGKDVGTRSQDGEELRLVLQNPLKVPLDVAIRMASTRNLNTALLKDVANVYTDNYDSPWELYVPYATHHLQPGQKVAYKMGLFIQAQPGEVPPPQVEFLVSFLDSKGRSVPTLLKRRVPLVPAANVPVVKGPPTEAAWEEAYRGGTYAFVPSVYDRANPNPELQFLADEQHLYVKVHAEDKQPSYYPNFAEPWNLPSDAVAIAFAPTPQTPDPQVKRIVVLPFAPEGPQLLTNNGVGKEQTGLRPLDTKAHPVSAKLTRHEGSWDLLIALPRKTVLGAADTAVMNVMVTINDETYHSEFRSWAREDLGPKGWGRVKLGTPAPATQPATQSPK